MPSSDGRPRAPDGAAESLRSEFLRWQCLLRQYSARFRDARPSPGMTPELVLEAGARPAGRLIVLLNRDPAHAAHPEFRHLHRRTRDPRERRDAVVRLLAATHYQRPERFLDCLSAVVAPDSPLADAAIRSGRCVLRFREHGRRFSLACRSALAGREHPVREESVWFARLFNPALPAGCRVLAFQPDWRRSRVG